MIWVRRSGICKLSFWNGFAGLTCHPSPATGLPRRKLQYPQRLAAMPLAPFVGVFFLANPIFHLCLRLSHPCSTLTAHSWVWVWGSVGLSGEGGTESVIQPSNEKPANSLPSQRCKIRTDHSGNHKKSSSPRGWVTGLDKGGGWTRGEAPGEALVGWDHREGAAESHGGGHGCGRRGGGPVGFLRTCGVQRDTLEPRPSTAWWWDGVRVRARD